MANTVYFIKENSPCAYSQSFVVGSFDKDKSIADEGLDYIANVYSIELERGNVMCFEETTDIIDRYEIPTLCQIPESEYNEWRALVSEFRSKISSLLSRHNL